MSNIYRLYSNRHFYFSFLYSIIRSLSSYYLYYSISICLVFSRYSLYYFSTFYLCLTLSYSIRYFLISAFFEDKSWLYYILSSLDFSKSAMDFWLLISFISDLLIYSFLHYLSFRKISFFRCLTLALLNFNFLWAFLLFFSYNFSLSYKRSSFSFD